MGHSLVHGVTSQKVAGYVYEGRDIDGRIILTWIFRKWNGDESSNLAAIAHIIINVRLSTCTFRCLLQGASPRTVR